MINTCWQGAAQGLGRVYKANLLDYMINLEENLNYLWGLKSFSSRLVDSSEIFQDSEVRYNDTCMGMQ